MFVAGLIVVLAMHLARAEDACSAMKIKELKELLARKGKVCDGCAEKSDFVTMCEEVFHLADVPEAERPAIKKAPRAAKAPEDDKKKSLDDILASLKGMPGMDGYATLPLAPTVAARLAQPALIYPLRLPSCSMLARSIKVFRPDDLKQFMADNKEEV